MGDEVASNVSRGRSFRKRSVGAADEIYKLKLIVFNWFNFDLIRHNI